MLVGIDETIRFSILLFLFTEIICSGRNNYLMSYRICKFSHLKRNKQSLIFNGSFHFNGQNETKYLRVADNQQPYLSALMLATPYLEKKGTLGTLMLTYFPP